MDIHTATEQAYRNGYEAGKRDAETKWTPVTEQLPERGQEVICYCGGVLKPTVYTHYFWDKDYDNWVRVTHWMPIPNPPTK